MWGGLRLRAPPPADATPWPVVTPDVFSIRDGSVEGHHGPIMQEARASRADPLNDLHNSAMREAWRALSSHCGHVIQAGTGQADEMAPACGVRVAHGDAQGDAHGDAQGDAHGDPLKVVRPAPRQPMKMPHALWMTLARADAKRLPDGNSQSLSGLAGCLNG